VTDGFATVDEQWQFAKLLTYFNSTDFTALATCGWLRHCKRDNEYNMEPSSPFSIWIRKLPVAKPNNGIVLTSFPASTARWIDDGACMVDTKLRMKHIIKVWVGFPDSAITNYLQCLFKSSLMLVTLFSLTDTDAWHVCCMPGGLSISVNAARYNINSRISIANWKLQSFCVFPFEPHTYRKL